MAIEMTFFSILGNLLIGPLKLAFEFIYEIAWRFVGHPGLAIIFLSLIMNVLVLPLYRRADAMQEEARDTEARLRDGVTHIKKTFSGDERMMLLQTYYRQNHYKPTDAFSGSVSLLLEIPFFLAAYQFLSHLNVLRGVSLGPITNLGAPDGLLVIGAVSVNLLPLLMTLINVVSSALYLKGFPLKTKLQLYGIALFFLVFLYGSPSGLVFYWTLNNLFSLVKNIFYKLRNPQKALRFLCAVAGLALLIFGGTIFNLNSLKKHAVVTIVALLLLLPVHFPALKRAVRFPEKQDQPQPNKKLFLLGSVFLTMLIGLLIPSVFIAASPQEYVDISYFHNPLWYLVSSLTMAAGTFLIWMRVFYWLASSKLKCLFDQLVWIICGMAVINYMFFGTNLGVISPNLQYENGLSFSRVQLLANLLILLAAAAVLYFCSSKWKQAVANVLVISIAALGAMSAWNLVTIKTSVDEISLEHLEGDDTPYFQLSTKGQNVIVFMLDRAMGELVPYMFNERPELREQFDGFTYYANTISFGAHTIFASPALFGGYEYTPVEINKRNQEMLMDKQNEALKVMPAIFLENGYDVTVCDPPFPNYQSIPDLSIYDDLPGVKAYITEGRFDDTASKQTSIDQNHRNFFCFSVMKSMPLFLQGVIYNDGQYRRVASISTGEGRFSSPQAMENPSVSTGVNEAMMKAYHVLTNLPNMTKVTTDTTNTFLAIVNGATHEPMLFQEPEYVPAQHVDNTAYDAEHTDRFTFNGRELKTDDMLMTHYQVNMATMIQLGNWFDYLRNNNVYDNTRIVLVSDHGHYLTQQLDELNFGNTYHEDAGYYFPLLMVKDFNASGFTTSDAFMTNADVPTLATDRLIQDPHNPYTGKPINSEEKAAHDQLITLSADYSRDKNKGTRTAFTPSKWASVHDDLWAKNNWTFYHEKIVLDEHALPQ